LGFHAKIRLIGDMISKLRDVGLTGSLFQIIFNKRNRAETGGLRDREARPKGLPAGAETAMDSATHGKAYGRML